MSTERQLNFINHLDELRTRIIICLVTIVVLSIGAYTFSDTIIEFLTRPIKEMQSNVYFFSPYEAFLVKLKAAFFAGLIFSVPVIFTQVWLFVSPGLYRNEERVMFPGAMIAFGLFLIGVAASYYWVWPFVLQFFLSFQSETLRPLISIKEYISACTGILISFGVIFNLPLVSAGLTKLGIVHHTFLRKQRRWVLVIIFIVAALITPPDVFTQILIAIPLIVLYELCIVISWFLRKK